MLAALTEHSPSRTLPWHAVEPLPSREFARLRRRAIFDCCKWDPQVEDVSTIADVPIVLTARAWSELSALAESLARETVAAENELRALPTLHEKLALPRALVKAIRGGAKRTRPTSGPRLIRFDFHHTTDGWRISEANTDVPGGLNEASGLPRLMAPHYPGTVTCGDAAGAYSAAVMGRLGTGAHIALAHATAYADDRQVMTYLARCLTGLGARTSLVSPSHLRWRDGHAHIAAEWATDAVDAIVRFFPAEWLPNLAETCGWDQFFRNASIAVSNPATAILTQSKRFPLTWDALCTVLPTWHALLPETRDPRDVPAREREDWVLKPALGRVGEGVGIAGVTEPQEMIRIVRASRRYASEWIAQRRFTTTTLRVGDVEWCPSIGVYTIDGRVAGAYGRLAARPLIDGRARDAAVLVSRVDD
jgi:glutathionylspermidine synthase